MTREKAYLGSALALALLVLGLVIGPVKAQVVQVPLFVQYALTAGAVPLSDSTILNTTQVARKITVKNASSGANNAYVGGELVANTPAAAGIELAAGQAYTFTNLSPASIYVVGTVNAANIAFIVAEY